MFSLKDRQHRSSGGLEFSCITPEPKGIEGCCIYQIKASIFRYSLGSNMESLICYEKCRIKSDFFTFIFCANTVHLIKNLEQCNFSYM